MKKTDFKWYKREQEEKRFNMLLWAVGILSIVWAFSGDALIDKWFF